MAQSEGINGDCSNVGNAIVQIHYMTFRIYPGAKTPYNVLSHVLTAKKKKPFRLICALRLPMTNI